MKRFFKFIIDENIFISLCATSLFLFYHLKAEHNFSLFSPPFVFLSTFLGYHGLRIIAYLRKDLEHAPATIHFYKKNKIFHLSTLLIGAIISTLCLINIEKPNFLPVIIACFFLLLYESFFTKKWSLRKLSFAKPFIIALVWSLFICGLEEIPKVLIWIDCFVFILLLSIPFDLKDIESDRDQKIKTFANEWKMTPVILSGGFICFSIYLVQINELFFASFACPLYIFAVNYYKKLPSLAFYLIFDGLIIFRFLFYFTQYQ